MLPPPAVVYTTASGHLFVVTLSRWNSHPPERASSCAHSPSAPPLSGASAATDVPALVCANPATEAERAGPEGAPEQPATPSPCVAAWLARPGPPSTTALQARGRRPCGWRCAPWGPGGTGPVLLQDCGTARRREGSAAATPRGPAGPAEELGYFVAAPSTQASLPPLNETPLLRDVQPLHLIKEIALQC